jgi:hypothetical protein
MEDATHTDQELTNAGALLPDEGRSIDAVVSGAGPTAIPYGASLPSVGNKASKTEAPTPFETIVVSRDAVFNSTATALAVTLGFVVVANSKDTPQNSAPLPTALPFSAIGAGD